MENLSCNQPNYINNYNAIQLSLPMEIGTIIDSDDEVISFCQAMEGVDYSKYIKNDFNVIRRGRTGYDKRMLLNVILFAYMINKRNYRDLCDLCRHDIRFMYLSNDERPSHMTFQRFEENYLKYSIDDIFFDLSLNIGKLMDIDKNIQYVDGTKFEANANKYSFVYKTRILNARMKLFNKITESIILLNIDKGFDFKYQYMYCSQEIGYIVQYLMEIMIINNIDPVYGKGKRKDKIQRYYDEFLQYYVKLNEYEYWLDIIGEDRNSCSKTDYDATMCATKMDYYCNTGLSRPCYNAQIAVSNGIIVNADLFQKPADAKTLMPFMERYHEFSGIYPKHLMGDAGYGSYDNYMYCLINGIELDMKYNYYAKKKEPDFKKKKFNPMNWEKDENGNKICPFGRIFNEYMYDKYDNSGEYLKINQKYKSQEGCTDCPYKGECYKGSGEGKILSRNVVLEQFYEEVDKNLATETGKELKKQRSIQAEGVFGVIKQDMGFTRFTRRGMENVKMEYLLVCIGYNLKKYHKYRLRKEKERKLN